MFSKKKKRGGKTARMGTNVRARVFNAGLLAGSQFASGRSCDRPTRSRFSVVFLGPRANGVGTQIPRCIACFTCSHLNGDITNFALIYPSWWQIYIRSDGARLKPHGLGTNTYWLTDFDFWLWLWTTLYIYGDLALNVGGMVRIPPP
jgi:hypothetical protein